MAKYLPNLPCPCQSGYKYKKCCAMYHKGAVVKNALLLMRSRYSAYAVGDSAYIMRTTHPENPDFSEDITTWRTSIDLFCQQTEFENLEILEWSDGAEEAFVTFRATLSSGVMIEKSRFLQVSERWLYVDGIIST